MLEAYRQHVAERDAEGVVPKPLDASQVAGLVELLKDPPKGEEAFLMELLTERVPPGVDEAAYVKAGFLAAVAKGEATSPLVDRVRAVEILGTMLGGYNLVPLIEALDDATLADAAASALSHTLLIYDAFNDVKEKADAGNDAAKRILQSWADAEWFLAKDEVPETVTVTVFKVPGETNTDDLSPATAAWSRPDIPLHALAMLENEREGVDPKPLDKIAELKEKGHPVAYVGDVVGTGSSRKSATNSVLWHMGDDIPHIPNRRDGGFVIGSKIAPIFYNTLEDAGALPIECDVDGMETGDVVDIHPFEGKVTKHGTDEVIATFEHASDVLLDEVRAGGRIPLIIGPRPDRPDARRDGASRQRRVPPSRRRRPVRPRLHARPEDRRTRLRRRRGAPGAVLRAAHDDGRQPGHDRSDDARRAQGPRQPRLHGRSRHAVVLPHGGLPEARRRRHPPHAPRLHHEPRRRLAPPRRRHHPLVAEPHAPARHRRHGRRLAHALPDGHQLPGGAPGSSRSPRRRARCRCRCPSPCS